MPVYQLLYVSGATPKMRSSDLETILAASRANNAGLGVTGLLLFGDGTFIQVLEGERSTVRRLVEKIRSDGRHRNFMELVEREVGARSFPDWQMGFKRLEPGLAGSDGVFRITRDALAGRIAEDGDGMMLDTVLAFAGRDFLAGS